MAEERSVPARIEAAHSNPVHQLPVRRVTGGTLCGDSTCRIAVSSDKQPQRRPTCHFGEYLKTIPLALAWEVRAARTRQRPTLETQFAS